MSNFIDDDEDDMFDEFDDFDTSQSHSGGRPTGEKEELMSKHNLGGYENMTEDEVKAFKASNELKQYGAEIDNDNIKTNYQGKTVQEMLGLSNLNESLGLSFNSIECYDIDIEIYQDIVDSSTTLQGTIAKGEAILPTFKYLHQDIFLSLYKYKAKLVPESQMHMSTRINRTFAESYLNTPEYITLRQTCRMDQFNSALGAEIIGNKLLKIIEEVMQQVKNAQQKMQKLKELQAAEEQMDTIIEQQQEIDTIINGMINNGQQPSGQMQAQQQALQQRQQELQAVANKLSEELDTILEADSIADEISTRAGAAFSETAMEVAETSECVNAWGLGEGENCRVSFQNKKDAIEKIRRSSKLKKMTDLIGRFKESAVTEQKKKTKNGATEIHSVKTGKEIQDTLPSERMNLCNDVTKKDFYNRWSEGKLLTYSKESNKAKNKGPIIVCCDTSGSMGDSEEMWSKAFAIGLLEIAQLQKRDFACITYSSSAKNPIIIAKNEISPEKVIRVAEQYDGGGTNFEAPLRKAMELINTSQFKDADIVFITDGDCGVGDEFTRKFKITKEEKEFKTQGILIDLGRSRSSDATLKQFCDNVTRISSVADLKNSESEVAKSIFGSI